MNPLKWIYLWLDKKYNKRLLLYPAGDGTITIQTVANWHESRKALDSVGKMFVVTGVNVGEACEGMYKMKITFEGKDNIARGIK